MTPKEFKQPTSLTGLCTRCGKPKLPPGKKGGCQCPPPFLPTTEFQTFYVDIPQLLKDGYCFYVNVRKFDNYDEALKFAQEKFGADEEGKICLISKG